MTFVSPPPPFVVFDPRLWVGFLEAVKRISLSLCESQEVSPAPFPLLYFFHSKYYTYQDTSIALAFSEFCYE